MDRQPRQARPRGARQSNPGCARQRRHGPRHRLEPSRPQLPAVGADRGRQPDHEADSDGTERHFGCRACRCRRCGAAAASQSRSHAAAGQGHPAVHRSTDAQCQPAGAGYWRAQCRRGSPPGQGAAHRHRHGIGRWHAQGWRQPAGRRSGVASGQFHAKWPASALEPLGRRGRHPPGERRRAVHALAAHLRSWSDLGARDHAALNGHLLAREQEQRTGRQPGAQRDC